MFSRIKNLKITMVMATVIAAMWLFIKHLLGKNAKLEHRDKVNEEIKDIHEQQIEDEKEILTNEVTRIDEKIKDTKSKSRRDIASSL